MSHRVIASLIRGSKKMRRDLGDSLFHPNKKTFTTLRRGYFEWV